MYDKVIGFILKQTDYKDNAAILTVLTKQYGKLSIVANGIKKMNSKNASRTLPYTKAEFLLDYKENKTMFTLRNVSTIQTYKQMHLDLQRAYIGASIAQVVDGMVLQGSEMEYASVMFDCVEEAFSLLESEDCLSVFALFLAEAMRMFGIGADVDECVHCGKKTVTSLSMKEGGFLCADCAKIYHTKTYTAQDLKRFRLYVKASLKHYEIVIKHAKATLQDVDILLEMMQMHAGIQCKAYDLYKRLYGE